MPVDPVEQPERHERGSDLDGTEHPPRQVGAHPAAPQTVDGRRRRREHAHQRDQLDDGQDRLEPRGHFRRHAALLEQRGDDEVPPHGLALQEIVLDTHARHSVPRTRTIGRRIRELQPRAPRRPAYRSLIAGPAATIVPRALSARRHETPRAPGVPRGGGSRLLAARRAATAATVGSAARRQDGAGRARAVQPGRVRPAGRDARPRQPPAAQRVLAVGRGVSGGPLEQRDPDGGRAGERQERRRPAPRHHQDGGGGQRHARRQGERAAHLAASPAAERSGEPASEPGRGDRGHGDEAGERGEDDRRRGVASRLDGGPGRRARRSTSRGSSGSWRARSASRRT